MDSKVMVIGLVLVGVFAVLRIVSQLRRHSRKSRVIDWDEHFIHGLRKAGVNTFHEHPVDFFFTVPSRSASEQLAAALRAEGYELDVREDAESARYSLHAQRRMRLVVPEMQALSAHFKQLAERHGGQYDHWAVVTRES